MMGPPITANLPQIFSWLTYLPACVALFMYCHQRIADSIGDYFGHVIQKDRVVLRNNLTCRSLAIWYLDGKA